ncbi:ORF131 [White spot syndrome virus]|uniref:ORF131 n=1 Tax=White spot syndrome virus TaxID=342409 RepID=A0A2D3I5B4_9VIRU|nr:ORF131 [White spot syndrome virus]
MAMAIIRGVAPSLALLAFTILLSKSYIIFLYFLARASRKLHEVATAAAWNTFSLFSLIKEKAKLFVVRISIPTLVVKGEDIAAQTIRGDMPFAEGFRMLSFSCLTSLLVWEYLLMIQ